MLDRRVVLLRDEPRWLAPASVLLLEENLLLCVEHLRLDRLHLSCSSKGKLITCLALYVDRKLKLRDLQQRCFWPADMH